MILNELSAQAFEGSFEDFYKQSLETNKLEILNKNGFKRQKNTAQFKELEGYRILDSAIVHVEKGHILSTEQWKIVLNLLKTNKIIRQEESLSPRFSGNPVILYSLSDGKDLYGMCVEYFSKRLPIVTTAFEGTEHEIEEWFKRNEEMNNAKIKKQEKRVRQGDGTHHLVSDKSESLLGRNSNNSITENDKNVKTLNDNFWKWFGNSKVVDKQGNPLEVYHGTKVDNIEVFKLNNTDKYPAIYFTDSYEVASTYAWAKPMKCYLRIEKPLIVDGERKGYYDGARDIIVDSLEKATKGNYDGVIINNLDDDAIQDGEGEIATTYIVFSPKQIKSVDNKGIWSDSDNIYEHLNEEEYKYVDNIEVLKLSPSDDMKVYRNFAKDFTNLRALIKGEDIYLWDAKQATHDQIADGLFGEDSELDNQFMFDTKYKELDDYSIRNTIDMYKFDKGTALGEKWYNDFFKYYEIIRNRLGVDFTKEGLEKVEYLKSLKIINGIKEGENIFETLNKEIERYL